MASQKYVVTSEYFDRLDGTRPGRGAVIELDSKGPLAEQIKTAVDRGELTPFAKADDNPPETPDEPVANRNVRG
jgi:hypothetical protein